MLSIILKVFVGALFLTNGIQGQFTCKNMIEIGGTTSNEADENCAENGKVDKCIVSISEGDSPIVTSGCLANSSAIHSTQCDVTIIEADGSSLKTCCCDHDGCNNATFLQNCKNDSLPIPTDRFVCHREFRKPTSNIKYRYHDCTDTSEGILHKNTCLVSVNLQGAESTVTSYCLPLALADDPCEITLKYQNTTLRQCCCDKPMCNNEKFAEKCILEAAFNGNALPTLQPSTPSPSPVTTLPVTTEETSTVSAAPPFKCVLSAETNIQIIKDTSIACEASDHNTCIVIISDSNENKIRARKCGEKRAESLCGLATSFNGSQTRYCCCNTSLCNDDTFMEECRTKEMPVINIPLGITLPPEVTPNGEVNTTPQATTQSFKCILSPGELPNGNANQQDCTSGERFQNKCLVMVSQMGNITTTTRSCVTQGTTCDTLLSLGAATARFCCCDGEMCNTEQFVQECSQRKSNTFMKEQTSTATVVPLTPSLPQTASPRSSTSSEPSSTMASSVPEVEETTTSSSTPSPSEVTLSSTTEASNTTTSTTSNQQDTTIINSGKTATAAITSRKSTEAAVTTPSNTTPLPANKTAQTTLSSQTKAAIGDEVFSCTISLKMDGVLKGMQHHRTCGDGAQKQCMVTIVKSREEETVIRRCVTSKEPCINSRTLENNIRSTTCCCDSHLCNDDEFADRCMIQLETLEDTGSASQQHVASTVGIFVSLLVWVWVFLF